MFSVQCRTHGVEVLLGPDSVVAIASSPQGIAVRWRCTCGEVGTWLATRGRPATVAQAA